jgi:hypothetical protein
MADTSRAQLYYVSENTWGAIPTIALNELRFTRESLGYNITTTASQEVRSDRQIADLIQTGGQASGGFDFELSYGSYDALLAAALFDAWRLPVAITASDDIAASNATSSFTSSVTDFSSAGLEVGQWVKVDGFSAASGANNGFYKVTSIAAGSLGVTPAPDSDEAAVGLTVTLGGSMVRNGVTETSFTLEKFFSDVGKYVTFTGMVPGAMTLSISTGSILTGSFSFNGKSGLLSDTTSGTGPPNAASVAPVLNAVDHVGEIREAGALMPSGAVQSLSLNLNNNLRGIQAVGSLGSVDIGAGRCNVTGAVTVYFSDGALYQKYLENTPTDISFRTTDADGNSYVFTLPRVKFTQGAVVAGGADQDVLANLSFQALRDPTTGCTLQIDRIAA